MVVTQLKLALSVCGQLDELFEQLVMFQCILCTCLYLKASIFGLWSCVSDIVDHVKSLQQLYRNITGSMLGIVLRLEVLRRWVRVEVTYGFFQNLTCSRIDNV